MVYIIPPNIKKFYDKWNVQNFVLLSLSLQIMLILLAPLRKRTANVFVIWLIWSANLLADWAANFAVGLISSKQVETLGPDKRADILAFWAPFLLLHLGGPDTLTSFALEDNALWLRHLVGLITQFITTFIVFGQSLPRNNLWVPTVLLFVAGTIKYGERTCALYHANLNRLRQSMLRPPDPGPNYAILMEEYTLGKAARLPTHRVKTETEKPNKESKAELFADDVGKLDDDEVVGHAYRFFNIFKGLIVDLIFSFRECYESRLFFHQRTLEEAFEVIAVELNFIYEVLYTKAVVVHSILGFIVRFISWSVVVAALLTFNSIDKKGFDKIDVRITYTLLFGAIVLDTIALFMLIFSDWTVASDKKSMEISFIRPIANCVCRPLRYYLSFKRINWPQAPRQSPETPESINCLEWVRRILFSRWSEYLYTLDFIEYNLKERPKTTSLNVFDYLWCVWICVIDTFGLKDFYDRMRYVSKKPCTEKLWNFIFEELKEKSKLADDPETAKMIFAARGDWILQDGNWNIDITNLMSYVVDVDYGQSLMLWHIAAELCNTMEEVDKASHENSEIGNNPDGSHELVNSEVCREISKTLSDYMLYLLVMQPTMMSAVAGIGQIRFRDSCAEAKKFFSTRDLKGGGTKESSKTQGQTQEHMEAHKTTQHIEACRRLLAVNTEHTPIAVKGHRSKSVLFDACILAKELRKLPKPNRWKLMSLLWVELLSYAAGRCRANTHAAQLSKGGELITFVWFLMTHLGIVERIEMDESHARAKLIVDK